MSISDQDQRTISDLIDSYQYKQGALLPLLHALQAQLGFIPGSSVPLIASALNLSRAEVHGVISFYHFFRDKPAGKHSLQICRAESCQAMGGRELEAHAKAQLGVDYHQTSADGNVTLLPVYCLGNCACSPAVRVGDDIYGLMNVEKLDELMDDLRTDVVNFNSAEPS